MHERIPNSALVVVEDAAHMPNLEQPVAFNLALERFLKQIEEWRAPRTGEDARHVA
jgi:pimeloyl-ACP methyl ester carboxylesterase